MLPAALDLIDQHIQAHYKGAGTVLVAGSYGRALRDQTETAPFPSSDIDIVVYHEDLSAIGLRAGKTTNFIRVQQDLTVPIDAMLLDNKALERARREQRQTSKCPAILKMLADGYPLQDAAGQAEELKSHVVAEIEKGPEPTKKYQAYAMFHWLRSLHSCLEASADDQTARCMLVLSSAERVANCALGLKDVWQSSTGHIFEHLKDGGPEITETFYASIKEVFEKSSATDYQTLVKTLAERAEEKYNSFTGTEVVELEPVVISGNGGLKRAIELYKYKRAQKIIDTQFLIGRVDRLADANRKCPFRKTDDLLSVWSNTEALSGKTFSSKNRKHAELFDAVQKANPQRIEAGCQDILGSFKKFRNKDVELFSL